MSKVALDFDKVESLREHAHLTMAEMAVLLGVSRVTYHGWISGKPIRPRNEEKAKQALRPLLIAVKQGHWPPARVRTLSSEQRLTSLLEILDAQA